MIKNKRTLELAILTDYLIGKIPLGTKGGESIVSWLNLSPYSPYVVLYGGGRSNTYGEENLENSFISEIDGKRRYLLEDNISFKFEEFDNIENKILCGRERLEDLINSGSLFNAYPEFRDIELDINISNSYNGNYSGSTYYDTDTNNPYKISVYADCNENAMRVLVHELQHCIQLREGFEIGESYYGGDGVMDMAIELERKYLDKNNRLDEDLILADGVDRLPRYFANYDKFQGLFKNKVSSRYAVLKSPIGDVKIHMKSTFEHFTNNTNKQNRLRYSGGLLPAIENPLFIVRDKHGDKDVSVFYKPMISKNKKEGLMHFAAFAVNDDGYLENSTYFDIPTWKLEKYIKTKEENLVYFKHAGSHPKCAHSESLVTPEKTRASDVIIVNNGKDVKGISKEDREKRLEERHKNSHKLTKNKDGSPKVFYHGLVDIEKIIGIIPDGMSRDGIYSYLEFNGIAADDLRDVGLFDYDDIDDCFVNPLKRDVCMIDTSSSYWNNKGEIESREIEDRYVELSYSDFMMDRIQGEIIEMDMKQIKTRSLK